MKWISKRGDGEGGEGGAFIKKRLPNGVLDGGKGGGGVLEEKWGLILRDFTLKPQSD